MDVDLTKVPKEVETKQLTKPEIDYYRLNQEGLNSIADTIENVIPNKYAKMAIISAFNDNIKTILKD